MDSFYFPSMTVSGKSDDRQIRVFISSTFRDMQAERDHLVKFIFPQLRKLCESRGVTWGEVDLRWGVTDEQAAEGKVLPICLEEIKRCRPYFIGLLGERYGWIPETLPADLVEREDWLKEHLHGKTSVTELEILHGVLRNPKMAGHAYFYFRDPTYVNSIQESDRKNFAAENAKDAEKLCALKERIRQSKFPLRENYPDPKALGELVLADLTKVINEKWPEGSQPDPLDREAMDHEAYAQSRERVYIGRQEYFDRLDAYASGNIPTSSPSPPASGGLELLGKQRKEFAGGEGPQRAERAGASESLGWGEVGTGNTGLCVLGESGSGKSALLANWVARYRQAHPDALVLQHYIGATPYSADWAAMLRRLMGEFKRRLGIQQDIPDQPDALRSAFPNWLYMAAAKGRVVLVLDALNQLEDRDGAPDLVWLPPVLPENVRLIVSTLPGRPLDEIQKRHWPTLKVELLSADERRKLIVEYLAQHAKALNAARVERIAAAPPSANPLYLRVLLDELRMVRTHEELEERIGDYLKAESPYALYEKVIARWEQDYEGDSDLVGDTLSLLWAARRGLTETELLQALGKDGEPLPRAKWSPLFLAMSDALISRGGMLTFAHDFLRTAVRNAYLPTEQNQQQAHLRLADYFEHHHHQQKMTPRKVAEWPYQLCVAKAWDQLEACLTNLPLFLALYSEQTQWELTGYWNPLRQLGRDMGGCYVRVHQWWISFPDNVSDDYVAAQIGAFLSENGLFESAKPLLRRALDIREKGLGVEHSDTLASLNNLAILLRREGNYAEAEPLYRRSLEASQRILGSEHPSTLLTSNNLAVMLDRIGNYDAAQKLYEQTLNISERVLGAEHPVTLCLINNLAGLLKSTGNNAAAKSLYERALEARKRVLGAEHPDTLSTINDMAGLLVSMGDYLAAELLYESVLQTRTRVLGTNHPDTIGSTCDLAGLRLRNEDFAEAQSLYQRALKTSERVLGMEHPDTLVIVNNLAVMHESREDHATAHPLYKRVMKGFLRTSASLGKSQPNLQIAIGNYERSLKKLGCSHEYAQKMIQETTRQFGVELKFDNGPRNKQANAGLQKAPNASDLNSGDMLRAQGDLAGALHVYRAVLVMWQRLAAADPANIEWHHNLSTSHFRIGDVLIDQGNFGEAAKHFSAAQTAASSLIELDPSNPEFRSLAEQAKAGSLSLKFYSIPVRIFFMITFLCLSGGAVTLALRGGYLWLLAGLLGVCSMIPAALFFLPTIHRLSRRNHFKRKRRRTDENRRA